MRIVSKLFTVGLLVICGCQDNLSSRSGDSRFPELYRFSTLQSRAVTQENPTGGKGLGGKDRGNGNCRKGAPAFRKIAPGEIKTLCDIQGPGIIRHIWMTVEDRDPEKLRNYILRFYWDDSKYPSVLAPMGDFFGVAHGRTANYMTPYLGTPEGRGFQCYFPMPFSKRCRITVENDSPNKREWFFYQVDYTLGDKVTDDMGRFHAHFRRENPCPFKKDYVLLDTHGSPGVFVGAVVGINPRYPGWWGEGEMKFYIDGDEKYPTICGTGTEDYLCSGWGMNPHSAIYTGVNYMKTDPNGLNRFISFYRFHVLDPIYFQNDLRVELQQLGSGRKFFDSLSPEKRQEYIKKLGAEVVDQKPYVHPNTEKPGKYMSQSLCERTDDYCSTVYWYQKLTGTPLPPLPSREERMKGIEKQSWEK